MGTLPVRQGIEGLRELGEALAMASMVVCSCMVAVHVVSAGGATETQCRPPVMANKRDHGHKKGQYEPWRRVVMLSARHAQ